MQAPGIAKRGKRKKKSNKWNAGVWAAGTPANQESHTLRKYYKESTIMTKSFYCGNLAAFWRGEASTQHCAPALLPSAIHYPSGQSLICLFLPEQCLWSYRFTYRWLTIYLKWIFQGPSELLIYICIAKLAPPGMYGPSQRDEVAQETEFGIRKVMQTWREYGGVAVNTIFEVTFLKWTQSEFWFDHFSQPVKRNMIPHWLPTTKTPRIKCQNKFFFQYCCFLCVISMLKLRF